jgi:hypothetical protein
LLGFGVATGVPLAEPPLATPDPEPPVTVAAPLPWPGRDGVPNPARTPLLPLLPLLLVELADPASAEPAAFVPDATVAIDAPAARPAADGAPMLGWVTRGSVFSAGGD